MKLIARLEGVEVALKNLDSLRKNIAKKIARRAMSAAGTVLKQQTKISRGVSAWEFADLELMRKAVTKRVYSKNGQVYAIVGIQQGPVVLTNGRVYDPSNVIGPLEMGHGAPARPRRILSCNPP